MSDDGIPGIPSNSQTSNSRLNVVLEIINEAAIVHTRCRGRSDIAGDVISVAYLRAEKDPVVRRFYRKEKFGKASLTAARNRLLVIVKSSYDFVSGRKTKRYLVEQIGLGPVDVPAAPDAESGLQCDVKEAQSRLLDEEKLAIDMKVEGMTDNEIQSQLNLELSCTYTIHQVRGILSRAKLKLQRYLRAYEPIGGHGPCAREDQPPMV
jgi:hypothetical protein